MHHYDYDQVKFVNHAFNPIRIECKVTEVEFVYLNQIAGPSFPVISTQSVFSHLKDVFVEMQMNPDIWTNQYVDKSTADLHIIKSFGMCWKDGYGFREKMSPRSHLLCINQPGNIFDVVSLQKLQPRCSNTTDVFICRTTKGTV